MPHEDHIQYPEPVKMDGQNGPAPTPTPSPSPPEPPKPIEGG